MDREMEDMHPLQVVRILVKIEELLAEQKQTGDRKAILLRGNSLADEEEPVTPLDEVVPN